MALLTRPVRRVEFYCNFLYHLCLHFCVLSVAMLSRLMSGCALIADVCCNAPVAVLL